MTRIIDPLEQFFDDAGNPLIEGLLYFYATGTNTPLDTFADVNLSIPNTNPLELTAAGRCPNAYGYNQLYRVILKSSADVQIMQRDNVGALNGDGALTPWIYDKVYNIPDIASYENKFYISKVNGNQDNQPDISTQWAQIRFMEDYKSGFSYSKNDVVFSNFILYLSLVDTNAGNTPVSSPNQWERIGSIPIYSTARSYAQHDVVYSAGDEYQSLQSSNLNHALTDSAWWVKRKKFEAWNSGKAYGSGAYAYDGEIRYISKQGSNTNHQPSADTSETWWKPDWQAFDSFTSVNTMSGGGTLKPYIPNMLTDGNAGYILPLASTVPNKGWIAIAKSDIARTLYPIITRSGSDTIAWLGGTDTSFQIDTQWADSMILYSNGSNQWSF
jgi:hypothetical protein